MLYAQLKHVSETNELKEFMEEVPNLQDAPGVSETNELKDYFLESLVQSRFVLYQRGVDFWVLWAYDFVFESCLHVGGLNF